MDRCFVELQDSILRASADKGRPLTMDEVRSLGKYRRAAEKFSSADADKVAKEHLQTVTQFLQPVRPAQE